MTTTELADGRVILHGADCRDVLRGIPDNSIDSIVTDPPYALVSITKRFGKPGSAPAKGNDAYMRASAGFMGKTWDTGEVAFSEEFWAECLRVLKPGGHVVAFSGTRTYHRMAVAIEDAGFEIRDQLGWLYGSGFPKSHDVSKAIDKMDKSSAKIDFVRWMRTTGIKASEIDRPLKEKGLISPTSNFAVHFFNEGQPALPTQDYWEVIHPLCVERGVMPPDEIEKFINLRIYGSETFRGREVVGQRETTDPVAWYAEKDKAPKLMDITRPATPEAQQWEGWGTALKPAWEPICLARKPLIGTVAENVLAYGTGALNIDGTRVPGGNEHELGRWPANIVHDGSDEVVGGFPSTKSGSRKEGEYGLMGYHGADAKPMPAVNGDSGSAARFFYCAKASRADRDEGLDGFEVRAGGSMEANVGKVMGLGGASLKGEHKERQHTKNTHPTVKPTDLMRWLARLVTPPGGVILDPFMGSGSTGKAAVWEGFRFIGCEREAEYLPIAEARIRYAVGNPPVASKQRKPANDNLPGAEAQAGDLFGDAPAQAGAA